ncbi:Glycosyl hydrolases family 2, TIM barrel domain [Bremerella volcania]|uniref:Glycosyl hydrolases family 2, TIM barrel domain n=1 Tax=Bremerella volcania TaxID=2527984 RepID=A0A518CBL5_9BACT|nr:glycoside hydrolase family 2 TIM barrel-domain containing protein [Bremerella volcania]QDU76622.1 Glycosyl hydrolases family 2, TIM barrel domain [Bremerella volcania]
MKWFWTLSFLLACTATHRLIAAEVKIAETDRGFQLLVDQKPFAIKGAGGDGDKELLAASGANAFRTWGIGDDTKERLDEAQKHGLKVALGIWLGHARHGFNYDDPAQVAKQLADAKAAVLKFKDHPAVLLWGVGNEMEGFEATTDPKVWQAVNDVARMIGEVDPHHPTMTVIAEIGGDKLPSIQKYCPDVDVVGINSYGGVQSIPERFANAGLDKPYIVTEFGPPGTWEIQNNEWGVPLELTSTEKASIYQAAYQKLAADPHCLGSFAFTWGFKQEATATWFGMFLPDGTKVAAVDAMTEAWSGKPPENLCPRIDLLEVVDKPIVEPNMPIEARLKVVDPEGKQPQVKWVLFREMEEFNTMGDYRPPPPTFPEAITKAGPTGVTVKMPQVPGNYRLFAYVHDGDGGGAVANVPLKVAGEVSMEALARGRKVPVPFTVYADDMNGSPYAASGYMGESAAIKLNEKSTTEPHSGKTCLEVIYDKADGWGGVVWQSPANDWGDRPGGFDLSAADTLQIWARGEHGGERVKFGFGLIDRDKPFYDTAKGEIEVTLTSQWQRFKIPLVRHNAGRIKTGFYWTLGGQGKPVTFYLDDIAFIKSDE